MFGFSLSDVCVCRLVWTRLSCCALQRPAIKPQDLNRKLLRLHVVIMSQQIPVYTLLQRDTCVFVGGWRWSFCLQLMSLLGGLQAACYITLTLGSGCWCLCAMRVWYLHRRVLAAYLFHALLTKFLWCHLDVKGNPMSARLPLQAQTCVCACVWSLYHATVD